MSYQDYLDSDHWRALRLKKYKLHNQSCAICGARGPLDMHHLFYRNLYDVQTSDLRKLCRACHKAAHKLFDEGIIVFRSGLRDTHHSRFSRICAEVKRFRFGHPTISKQEIRERFGIR